MKKIFTCLLAISMLLSIVACGVTSSNDENVFRFTTTTETTSLDPHLTNAEWVTNVTSTVFEGLVRRYNGEVIPGLAESWSNEGLVYTFNLRQSTWSDGVEITANDFVNSWNLLNVTETPQRQFVEFFVNENDELNIEAIDDYTLQVTLKNEVPYIMEFFASPVLVPIRIDAFGDNQELYYQSIPTACNGPFILVEWNANDSMIMVKNESYWNASAVSLDGVEIYTVKDEQTQINMFETGEIDMAYVPTNLFNEYESKGMQYFENGSITFIAIPDQGSSIETAEFLANRDFLQALSYTFDREDFVNSAFSGAYNPADTYLPMSSTGYIGGSKANTSQIIETPYQTKADLDKAEESLQKALDALGYTKDEMPTFVLMSSDVEARQTSAIYIQDVAKQIGIDIKIETVPSSQYWSLAAARHPYDFTVAGFGPDVDDATSFLSSYGVDGGYALPYLGWTSLKYDELLANSWLATGDERSEYLVLMEELLLTDGPVIPLYTGKGGWLLNDRFTGVYKNTTGNATDFVFAVKN